MSKPNRFDSVLAQIEKRTNDVSSLIEKDYKNVRPFDSVEVSAVDRLWAWDSITEDQKYQLAVKYGGVEVFQLQEEIEQIRKRRGV